MDDIRIYNQDRPETKEIGMISPAIDSIIDAIKKENPQLFRNSFTLLTNRCNECHIATEHEFNVIKIPDIPPFSNQVFSSKKNDASK